EVINFGKKIKIKKNVPLRNSIDFTYKTTHYKNGIEIDPFDFWGTFSEDTKLIDSTKIGNTETKIYQSPVKVITNRIPIPRSKTFYNYEITGQVLTK
ncbi:MAG TPA: hypothetical protein PLS50_09545, partial [Candidatus Dojkabacteria bacterium]|nr:hypothetical protein [Candidatus Dojkabacteria bacterium]